MKLINKLVSKNLLLNKKRSIVTIIGIILSTALLVAVTTMITSFQKSLIVFEKSKGGDYHFVFTNMPSEDLNLISNNRKIESFYQVMELGYASFPESKNEAKPYYRVVNIDSEKISSAGINLIEGRMPENSNEVVIPAHIKTNARVVLNVGDTLNLGLGRRVAITDEGEYVDLTPDNGFQTYWTESETKDEIVDAIAKKYTIVGVIERCPMSIEPYVCPGYTLVTCGESVEGKTTDVYARLNKKGLKEAPRVAAGIFGLDADLVERVWDGGKVSDQDYDAYIEATDKLSFGFNINSWLIQYERVWPLDNSLLVVFAIGIIVAIIIITTSVYCIKNSFEISISEKIRQYGMLASIGATSRQIKKSVHTEAAILGAVGIPFGVLLGNLAAFILIKLCNTMLTDSLNVYLIFSPALWGIAIALVLSILTIFLSAQRSAVKAGKISPMEAIRNQTEIKLSAREIKTPLIIEKLCGIGGVISYKNIKRNRKKYRTTTVSIVICTITFIVVSYFISMTFTLLGMAYSTEKANLEAYIHNEEKIGDVVDVIKSLDNIEEVNITVSDAVSKIGLEWTAKEKEYQNYLGIKKEEDMLSMIYMDDEYFDKYAKSIGASLDEEGVILINTSKYQMYYENDKEKSGEIEKYAVKKGDIFSFVISPANHDVSKEIECELPVIGVTDERPLGYMNLISTPYGVMKMSTADKLGLLSNATKVIGVYCLSSNPDALQDDMEKILEEAFPESSVNIFNSEANRRAEKSLMTMIAIFAYGFIVVIALIGITNIVNTLNTGMELRAREFASLRSIGMTNSQFNKMVLLESIFTAGKSLLLGNIIGVAISFLINFIESKFDTEVIFRPPVMACVISIVVVMLLIYTIIRSSMSRINKRNIIETIKKENL